MRAYGLAAAVLGVVASGTTARGQKPGPPVDVTVYVTDGGLVPSAEKWAARVITGRMFAHVGVRIAWLDGKPGTAAAFASPVVIHVRFLQQTMRNHSSEALAYVTPFAEGANTITVLVDRIRLVTGWPTPEPHIILAHVLAHEIGHVLLGSERHAPTGVMKARWDRPDFDAMEKEQLEFTSTDVDLIRERLNRLKAELGIRLATPPRSVPPRG